MEVKLSTNEQEVLNFLKKQGKALNKSMIGVSVGKRQPKNAAAWSSPILDSLIEKGLIEIVTENGKQLYQATGDIVEMPALEDEVVKDKVIKKPSKKSEPSKQLVDASDFEEKEETEDIEVEAEIVTSSPEVNNQITDAVTEKPKRKKVSEADWDYKKAKKVITKMVEEAIAKKGEWDSKGNCISKALNDYENNIGHIPEEYFQRVMRPIKRKFDPSPKKEKGVPRANLLDKFDKVESKAWAVKHWEDITANADIPDNSKKRQLSIKFKEYVSGKVSEKSMKANMIKSFISTTIREVISGNEREFKNDGREFTKGMKVEYLGKNGVTKTGVISRIFMDKVFYQRTIIIMPDGADKTEMKIDRKITKVIS